MAAPVDYNGSWQESALRGVDKLATDDLAQMEFYRAQGWFANTPVPYSKPLEMDFIPQAADIEAAIRRCLA